MLEKKKRKSKKEIKKMKNALSTSATGGKLLRLCSGCLRLAFLVDSKIIAPHYFNYAKPLLHENKFLMTLLRQD
jgi:hypothetical protein